MIFPFVSSMVTATSVSRSAVKSILIVSSAFKAVGFLAKPGGRSPAAANPAHSAITRARHVGFMVDYHSRRRLRNLGQMPYCLVFLNNCLGALGAALYT